MVSVFAPVTAVRFSPQAFVVITTLGRILVDHIKVVDTFSIGTVYARHYEATEKRLGLYHINFWSYIGSPAKVCGYA